MTLTLTFQGHWVKCNHTNGLPIYAFLLVFNGNISFNSTPLQDTKLRNLYEIQGFEIRVTLTLTFQGHSRQMWCVIGLSIYGFLLIYMSKCMSIAHRLAVIATQNVFFYLLSLGPNYEKYRMISHPMTSKWAWMLQGQRYPIYVKVSPATPKFHSVLFYDRSLSR